MESQLSFQLRVVQLKAILTNSLSERGFVQMPVFAPEHLP